MSLETHPKNLLVIDGYALFYKVFFALSRNPLINSKGQETTLVFGFFNVLHTLLRYQHFDYVAIALESKTPTLRKELYADYKSTRSPMSDSLKSQINDFLPKLPSLGIPILQRDGLEADDMMASVAICAKKKGIKTFLATSDKDLYQLIDDDIVLINTNKKSEVELTTEKDVIEKWGVSPAQILDLLSLLGDTSDNIPGVKGIGAKGAAKLISTHQSLDLLYANIHNVHPETTRQKLLDGKESAYFSKQLIALHTTEDIPIDNLALQSIPKTQLMDFLKHYELNSLIRRYDNESNSLTLANFAHSTASVKPTASKSASKPLDTLEDVPALASFATRTAKEFQRTVISTPAQLSDLVQKIQQQKHMVFDFETTALDPHTANLVSIAVAFLNDNTSYFVPLLSSPTQTQSTQQDSGDLFSMMSPTSTPSKTSAEKLVSEMDVTHAQSFWDTLKPLLANPSIAKIGHNLKYEYQICHTQGVILNGIAHDTMIAEYLIDSGKNSYKLENLVAHHFGEHKLTYKDLTGGSDLMDTPLASLITYALEDVEATALIANVQTPLLKVGGNDDLQKVLLNIDQPLLTTIAHMELAGVLIDSQHLKKLSASFESQIEKLTSSIHTLSGSVFNINSTKQLQEVLFEKLAIPSLRKTKTGYSTDMDVLEKLAPSYPICSLIVDYRTVSKLKSTYTDSLQTLVNPKTHRIHTNYNQTVASTGRLSSSNPNLQNIPIRTAEGKSIRTAFIAPKDHLVVSFDYSQVELRVLAHISGCPVLTNAFQNNADIHQQTAKAIFNTPNPTDDQRRIGKTINFSVIYGISAFSLGEDLKVSPSEAKHFIDTYFATYPKVQQFIDETIALTQKQGYISTFYGRRRPLPEINSSNKNLQQRANRMAFNTVIQGTASDIIKLSMNAIDPLIQNKTLPAQMVMQVHDELVFYVHQDHLQTVLDALPPLMTNVQPFSHILKVDSSVAPTWS